jgi:flagellar basal-body rod protein FlgG
MLNAFYISSIGLEAQKQQLDALANNMANVGTAAFKRQSVDFSAILDRAAGGTLASADGPARPNGRMFVDQSPGTIRATGRALDVAIVGAGFLEVGLSDGVTGYSRAGALQIDADGALTVLAGHPLAADIRIPGDAKDVRVLPNGEVTAVLGDDAVPTVLGQIELVTFANPELLAYRGEGVFTPADGVEPTHARPGEDGTSLLAVGSLEGSNVKLTDEMVALMLMQRIYELNSRIAQAADELIGMSNNMRRS